MKKIVCIILAACMLFALAACGAKPEAPAEAADKDWTREGYFTDENGNVLSVTLMEDVVDPGWYVGVMIGDYMGGNTLAQEGGSLRGDLNAWDDGAEPFVVTLSEEGEDGLLLAVEGGESYHFVPMELPSATIFVSVNTEGWGNIDWTEGEEAPEIDPEYPYQSALINLAEPAVHTFLAWPEAGNVFVKWTKNGEDFSTEPQITVLLDESADYVAVFEEDPDWQNPVMNFVGEYQCDRAHATVSCSGFEDAWILIEWGSSAWELTRWDIFGRLDLDTLTIDYSGSTMQNLVFDDSGEIKSEEIVYDDGSGTVVFHDDGTFTWHEDKSERGEDLLFTWVPTAANTQERAELGSGDPDYYGGVTAMEKIAVEEIADYIRTAYLEENWEALTNLIRYPISVRGTELADAEAFLAFMSGMTVDASDRTAMAEENCHDMFYNGQGICMGSGEVWIIDRSYMTDDDPQLQIIALNGIVER